MIARNAHDLRLDSTRMKDDLELTQAIRYIADFAASGLLSTKIGNLEKDMDGKNSTQLPHILKEYGVSEKVLHAGFVARRELGQINDLIHALSISLVLETILETEEIIERAPSLAAGNDPGRPYDLETDLRVAEFKLARWKGSDSSRQRDAVKDFVHLAADQSGRRAELYVLGPLPAHFLRTTSRSIESQLRSSKASLDRFEGLFGDAEVPVSSFVLGPGSHVDVIDLETLIPNLFGE